MNAALAEAKADAGRILDECSHGEPCVDANAERMVAEIADTARKVLATDDPQLAGLLLAQAYILNDDLLDYIEDRDARLYAA